MRYKNKRNGAVLESMAAINGEDWVEIPFTPPAKPKKPIQEPVPEDTPKKKTRRRKVAK